MPLTALAPSRVSLRADDDELVRRVRAGDERAFEVLYGRYAKRVGGYVRGMVRDDGRAEDVCQEIFISALRRMRATEQSIAFKPWIFEIARNACIDAHRRAVRVREVSMEAPAAGDDEAWLADRAAGPDAEVANKQQIDDLLGAFGGLSDAHHEILVLRELDGLTYEQIGDRLDMSFSAVESSLFRARRRLGEEYGELVSGRRCERVQRLIGTAAVSALGVRDRRRLARHVAHCQPCRRCALAAGVPVAPGLRARVAGLLPLPYFLRRRPGGEDPVVAEALGAQAAVRVPAQLAAMDPGMLAGWPRAVATAAGVAVAGLGAGTVVVEQQEQLGGGSPREAQARPGPAATSSPAQPGVPGRGGAVGRANAAADSRATRDGASRGASGGEGAARSGRSGGTANGADRARLGSADRRPGGAAAPAASAPIAGVVDRAERIVDPPSLDRPPLGRPKVERPSLDRPQLRPGGERPSLDPPPLGAPPLGPQQFSSPSADPPAVDPPPVDREGTALGDEPSRPSSALPPKLRPGPER